MVAFDEIDHEAHPNHKLKLKNEEKPYKCDVCKELGLRTRYTCEEASCDFHLHVGCAKPTPTLQHDFYRRCNFFYVKEGIPRRVCDACGMTVQGSVYHCYDENCGRDLHPCCALLERLMRDGEMKLKLHRVIPSKCIICGEKKMEGMSTWGYVSTKDKNCSLHIACAKRRMVDIWLKQKSLGTSSERGSAGAGDGVRALAELTPILQLAVNRESNASAASGKSRKFRKMAQIAITFIIAAVLGEPTALIASLICNLFHQ